MSGSKEKDFRKVKRSYTWLSIVLFVFLFIISEAIVNGSLLFFSVFSIHAKIDSQFERTKELALIYEQNEKEESAGLLDLLHRECPDYIVLEKNGTRLDGYGEDTRSTIGGHLGLVYENKEFRVYEDAKDNVLHFRSGGLMLPGLTGLLDAERMLMEAEGEDWDLDLSNLDENGKPVLRDEDLTKVIDMPVWIETKLSDGNFFAARVHVRIRVVDTIIFMIAGAVLNAILLTVLIIRLVSIIRGFIRKKRMTDLFLVDSVTKGNNWMAFLLKGERILKKGKNADRRYAIVHLTIVKYRNYCMCHSLEEGQRLLFNISNQIERTLSQKDELSAHVTSSSFALLLDAASDDSVKERLETLLETLKQGEAFHFQMGVQIIEPNLIDGRKKKRADAGIEQAYNNAVTAKSTLESSDDDGIAFFDDKLMEDERWITMVEEHQQKALDNAEFVVYYQPKYSPDKAELIGAEALIRWQSPDFGFVPPGRFIPIFEKNGFITQIDHYMINHVARDQKRWFDAGMRCVPVSVNVSRAHFAEEDLADQIREMVDSTGIPRSLIEIELTESAFFDDKNAIIHTIERLKYFGFSVSMDDFGSGYSSLNSLKDMNLDVLKLDADFFRGDADPERKEAVVSEAIKLAKRLNMRTVAEGVEDREQVEFLRQQGCDMIQGYYFAKPMPRDEYEQRMKEKFHQMP